MKAKEIIVDQNRQEVMQNIPGFPVTCYFNQFSGNTYDLIDWHWHLDFQLCLVTQGTVIWHTENKTMSVREGNGIFINSQKIHMAKPADRDRASFFCLDIRPDFLCPDAATELYQRTIQPILSSSSLTAIPLSPGTDSEKQILADLSAMNHLFQDRKSGYEYCLMSLIFSIWAQINPLLMSQNAENETESDQRIKDIFLYIQSNFPSQISLDQIAESASLSRSECCRYFKRKTGQTIFEYLTQYRIRKSLTYLRDTDWDIARIAQETGFSSQSYYTACFKKLMKITPRQYRSQLQKP